MSAWLEGGVVNKVRLSMAGKKMWSKKAILACLERVGLTGIERHQKILKRVEEEEEEEEEEREGEGDL
jgi:hypothetical protein